jgi:pyruvate kinase
MTEKDKNDLRFAVSELSVDYVALSFVREAYDIELLKLALKDMGSHARVIAKLEKPQAIENFESILASLSLGDGIMIARGDLGVEVDIEKVPALQKRMITRANQCGIVCITATQMLESMMDDTVPSRAEASDIFNATLDGTDAVMLSGETAVGHYPVEAVRCMVKIINEAEDYNHDCKRSAIKATFYDSTFSFATVRAACSMAETADAKGLVCLTHSGRTAVLMSKLSMPEKIPFFAMTPRHITYNRLAMYYGVHPVLMPNASEPGQELWDQVDRGLSDYSTLKQGDTVVIALGYKISDGHTNVCKIVRLGHREYY